ncbi:MAG: alpha/beta hydrolase [Magnetococcales bacterium]|nr:alpha/beta hydrolase [Magnetococcales bacterium]
MLFVTNRTLKQSHRSRKDRPVDFVHNDNRVSQSVFFCERFAVETLKSPSSVTSAQYLEIGGEAFFKRLKNTKAEQILLYIHGVNSLPEPHVFSQSMQLQMLFERHAKGLVQVVPLIWPCARDSGIVREFWDDQQAAEASAAAFARMISMFMVWRENEQQRSAPCSKRINMLAHSMGGRVLMRSMDGWAEFNNIHRVPILFRNTFLMAPDISNDALEAERAGRRICESSRNVSIYYSGDDLMMLPASTGPKGASFGNRVLSRRLGQTGPEDMDRVPKNVFSLDCDDFSRLSDPDYGHRYFLEMNPGVPTPAFEHMLNALKTGRPYPRERSAILSEGQPRSAIDVQRVTEHYHTPKKAMSTK